MQSPAVVEAVTRLLDVADAVEEAGPAGAAAGGVFFGRESGCVVGSEGRVLPVVSW